MGGGRLCGRLCRRGERSVLMLISACCSGIIMRRRTDAIIMKIVELVVDMPNIRPFSTPFKPTNWLNNCCYSCCCCCYWILIQFIHTFQSFWNAFCFSIWCDSIVLCRCPPTDTKSSSIGPKSDEPSSIRPFFHSLPDLIGIHWFLLRFIRIHLFTLAVHQKPNQFYPLFAKIIHIFIKFD